MLGMNLAERKTTMLNPAPRQPMDPVEARALTDRIARAVDRVWALLLEAYTGRAWEALGYRGWRAYVVVEFAMSPRRAHQLLDQARVERALQEAGGSTEITIGEREARAVKSQLPEITKAVRLRVVSEPKAQPQDIVDEVVDEHRRAPSRGGPTAPPAMAELPEVFDPARVDATAWVTEIVNGLRAMPPVDTLVPRIPRDPTYAAPLPAASRWLRALATEGRKRCSSR